MLEGLSYGKIYGTTFWWCSYRCIKHYSPFLLGKIAGVSGILGSLLSRPKKSHHWKSSFLIGLILGGLILKTWFNDLFNYSLNFNSIQIIIAGLLVGFGTRLGSGCTSGHGVSGLPLLSKRSLVATLTFMLAGVVTVYIKGAV
ncbi:MAG: YeeE/YedE family protein [Halobacteriovoraceae bacterium]|nr:YeeE/YedE family protein [Halobacteriovoraceae bacterium]